MKKLTQFIIAFIFIAVIMGGFVVNLPNLYQSVKQYIQDPDQNEIETTFQSKLWNRDKAIDIYGLSLKLLRKNIIGNYEFVRDEAGIVQMFSEKINASIFVDSMHRLKSKLDKQNTPLIYVAMPDKTKHLPLAKDDIYAFDGQESKRMGDLLTKIEQPDIDVIDIQAALDYRQDAPAFEEFFFRTDVHCTTLGEFYVAKIVAEHLREHYGIAIAQDIFNLDNYDIVSYDFCGNTVRSVGKHFTQTDEFEIYYPRFETKITMENPLHETTRAGSFKTSVLNGMEDNPTNIYTYWVTNFGQFTLPYYRYINHLMPEDAPSILVICDSVFMRGFSYLLLGCKELHVLDPRYFADTDYTAQVLGNHRFDAVIVLGSYIGFYTSPFAHSLFFTTSICPEKLDAEIVSHTTPEIISTDGQYSINITVKNTGEEEWNEKEQIRLCIWVEGIDWGYRIHLPQEKTVLPGEYHTFTLHGYHAPPRDSTCLEFQMLQEGITYFGERERVDIRIVD